MNKDDIEYLSSEERGVVAAIWGRGEFAGAEFFVGGKKITWQKMTLDQRESAVNNILHMGNFFKHFLDQSYADIPEVEDVDHP